MKTHAKLHMIAHGIDEDAQDHEHTAWRHDGLRSQTDKHENCADPVNLFRRVHVQGCQNEHQQKTGQLPEEFRDSLVKAGHPYDLRQIVVDDSLVEAVRQPHRDHREEKGPVLRLGPEDGLQTFPHDFSPDISGTSRRSRCAVQSAKHQSHCTAVICKKAVIT